MKAGKNLIHNTSTIIFTMEPAMPYTPIRTSVLRGDQKISFDVYVEINSKHILYLRKGDSFEGSRLLRLKDKKVKKMYITPESEQLYREYMEQNIDRAYGKNSTQNVEDRVQIAHGLQQAAVEARSGRISWSASASRRCRPSSSSRTRPCAHGSNGLAAAGRSRASSRPG